MKISNQILNTIKNSKNVAIFAHNKPDGDCLGSALALKLGLAQLNIKADIYCDDIISSDFDFLPDVKTINTRHLDTYDLAVSVDTASSSMIGKNLDLFYSINNQIKIDHHIEGQKYTQQEYVNCVSSTCLIIYFLLKQLNVKISLDTAICLYTGICCDTGCFRYNYTKKDDYLATAEFVDLGVDTAYIVRQMFLKNTPLELELKRRAFNNMQYLDDICLSYLTLKDLKELGITENDAHGVIDTFNVVEGYRLSIMLCEVSKNNFKVSIRSHDSGSAAALARYFGGGGHLDASGCRIFGTLKTVINQLVKAGKETNDGVSVH